MRRKVVIGAICAAVLAAGLGGARPAASTPGDWPMWHGNPLHTGVSPDTTITSASVTQLHQVWATSLGGNPVISSPMVAYNATLNENLVYEVTFSTQGTGVTAALDATTGTVVWTAPIGDFTVSSPVVDGNTVYIGDDKGDMHAFDAATGALVCQFQLPVIAPQTTPGRIEDTAVVGHDSTGPIVYFGDVGQEEAPNHGRMWAIYGVGSTQGQCTKKWMRDLGPNTKKTGTWSPPALVTDSTGRQVLVFGTSQPDDGVYDLAASDGSVVWHFATLKNLSDADVGAAPTIGAPGVNGFGDGVVYIDGKDKIEYAIDLLTGHQLWSFDLAANAGKNTNCVSTAVLVGNQLVIPYSKYLYSFNATTGALMWRSPATSGNFLGSPILSGGSANQVILDADLSGRVYAHSPGNGAVLKTLIVAAQSRIDASIAISNGMAFIAAENGFVYGLAVG